jgi:hypothetical protein
MDFDDIKDKLAEQKDKVEDGLEKAGDFIKDKFGHDEQVDQGVEKAKDVIEKLDDN